MAAKQSAIVDRAIKAYKKTPDVYMIAKRYKLAPSTLYRAIYRAMPELNKVKHGEVAK